MASGAVAAAIDGDGGVGALPEDDEHQPLAHLGLRPTPRPPGGERLANHAAVVRRRARRQPSGLPARLGRVLRPERDAERGGGASVDAALRHVHALLAGPDAAVNLSPLEPATTVKALGYLRDRVSVPRDMSYPAARRCGRTWWMAAAVRPR